MSEGPILLSTVPIGADDVRCNLEELLLGAVRNNQLANLPSTRVLVLSGTHGSKSGLSGITDKRCLLDYAQTRRFYREDCDTIGVVEQHSRPAISKLPLPVEDIPDIMEPMMKQGSNSSLLKKSRHV